jgi:hypothetical protein
MSKPGVDRRPTGYFDGHSTRRRRPDKLVDYERVHVHVNYSIFLTNSPVKSCRGEDCSEVLRRAMFARMNRVKAVTFRPVIAI